MRKHKDSNYQRNIKTLLWLVCTIFVLFQSIGQDAAVLTEHQITLHFVHGSKPKRGYKDIEKKYFGGIHGGHVTIQKQNI